MVSVEAIPAPDRKGTELITEELKTDYVITHPTNEVAYFDGTLKSIQGAITDTLSAGKDLELMEDALQNIVNNPGAFWRTESATEYATASSAYENEWKDKNGR